MRATPIPAASRETVQGRSLGRCERCGGRGAEWHHRRSRSVRDAHTHCACNGVLLCGGCHRWVHGHPAVARREGFIVPRHLMPAVVPFLHWNGAEMEPDCHGSFYVETSEEQT